MVWVWGGLGRRRGVLHRRCETLRAAPAFRVRRCLEGLLAGTYPPPTNVLGVSGIALQGVLEHLVIRKGHLKVGLGESKLCLEVRLRFVRLLEL